MSQVMSARQAAELLFSTIPHEITPAVLEEYGLEASEEQAQLVTREVLLLDLYWVRTALEVNCSRREAEGVMSALLACIGQHWETTLKLRGHDPESLGPDLQARRRLYDAIVQEGGASIAVLTETAALLEAASAIREEDRGRMLALLLDLVPVDEIGELVAELQLADESQR